MELVLILISLAVAGVFFVLWIRERRQASEAEIVAYGLRAQDDKDDNTKTSISAMKAEFNDAMSHLEQMGEIKQDDWGRWVWVKTGKQLGKDDE
jgi:hypothetical protein